MNDKSDVKTEFNSQAQKIIKLSELKEKVKELYKTELSFGEKVLLNVLERPSTCLGAAAFTVRLALSEDMKQDFRRAAGDFSKGFYTDGNESYINTGILPLLAENDAKFSLTKSLTEKTRQLDMKAVEQCKDYSDLYQLGQGKLKPSF
jgi:hypothetical protein